jgi:hypothetical protein
MSAGEAEASAMREEQARKLDQVGTEASRLADHARIAAAHFRNNEVPRAAAHALASSGHLANIRKILDEIASVHASRARTTP